MPAWTLWLFLAALLILPVLLRLHVGDEPPSNEITHEQDPDREDGRADIRLAALGFPVPTLETLLAAVIDAQRALDAPPPTCREVVEAVAYLGLLSDADERWFRPAVAA